MCQWNPHTTKTGGLPNISFIARKPRPLGTEFKNVGCQVTHVTKFLEIQRGREGMRNAKYSREHGVTAACMLRLMEGASQPTEDDEVEC